MIRYEYKVVPAPQKGTKARGVKTAEGRFALSVQQSLNALAAEGWEYLRAELLPSEERSGITGSTVNWRNVLVFRRPLAEGSEPTTAEVEMPSHTPEGIPLARPVPGPGTISGPARISQESNDPPLSFKRAETQPELDEEEKT